MSTWNPAAAKAMERRLIDTDTLRKIYISGRWDLPIEPIIVNRFASAIDYVVHAAGSGLDPLLAMRDALVGICRDHARLSVRDYEHSLRSVKPLIIATDGELPAAGSEP